MLRALIQSNSHHKDSWAALLRDDLVWMQTQLGTLDNMPDPRQAMQPWEDLMTEKPKSWTGIGSAGILGWSGALLAVLAFGALVMKVHPAMVMIGAMVLGGLFFRP